MARLYIGNPTRSPLFIVWEDLRDGNKSKVTRINGDNVEMRDRTVSIGGVLDFGELTDIEREYILHQFRGHEWVSKEEAILTDYVGPVISYEPISENDMTDLVADQYEKIKNGSGERRQKMAENAIMVLDNASPIKARGGKSRSSVTFERDKDDDVTTFEKETYVTPHLAHVPEVQ